jgi:hypothetical protein
MVPFGLAQTNQHFALELEPAVKHRLISGREFYGLYTVSHTIIIGIMTAKPYSLTLHNGA